MCIHQFWFMTKKKFCFVMATTPYLRRWTETKQNKNKLKTKTQINKQLDYMKTIYNFKINDTVTKWTKKYFILLGFNTWLLQRHLRDVIIIIFLMTKNRYHLPNNTQDVSLGRGFVYNAKKYITSDACGLLVYGLFHFKGWQCLLISF